MPRIPVYALPISVLALALLTPVAAQQSPASPPTEPQVKVNMLNVCTPSADEQKEIASALSRVPKQPLFGADFEVTRGRSTLTDMPSFLKAGEIKGVVADARELPSVRPASHPMHRKRLDVPLDRVAGGRITRVTDGERARQFLEDGIRENIRHMPHRFLGVD